SRHILHASEIVDAILNANKGRVIRHHIGGSWSKACRWPCQQQSNQLRIEGVLTSKKPTAVGHQHAAGLTIEVNRQRLIVITQFSTLDRKSTRLNSSHV